MIDQWENCYSQGWGKNLVPEAFSHPAKVSFSLAGKIYDHAINQRWIKKGDFVLDPFGGICGFGFHALCYGLNFIAVELEEKFVKLGEQNIELWNRELKGWPNLGTARIVQGDSRRLKDVIREASLIVSSPPFSSILGSDTTLKYEKRPDGKPFGAGKSMLNDYGHTSGNLDQMPEGNFQDVIEKADLILSSPPYAGSMESDKGGIDWEKAGRVDRTKPSNKRHSVMSNNDPTSYGQSPGQLGSMKEGSIDAVISSPPYEASLDRSKNAGREENIKRRKLKMQYGGLTSYSEDPGQMGNFKGDTFWSASREIVQQCHDLLKDGGHAIWVCKDYIKAKKRIPFSDRWLALCESVGFKLVCRHQAMLVKKDGEQFTTRGNQLLQPERKSFFRRNYETKVKAANFWPSLEKDLQDLFIEQAKKLIINPKRILEKAQVLAFKSECLDDRPYRDEIIIENEDVLCLEK